MLVGIYVFYDLLLLPSADQRHIASPVFAVLYGRKAPFLDEPIDKLPGTPAKDTYLIAVFQRGIEGMPDVR